jgi:hypothetical protein
MFKKSNQTQTQTLSGPPIDNLIKTVQKMQSYQDVDEQYNTVHQNNMGWAKGHAGSQAIIEILKYPLGSEVPVPLVSSVLKIISLYRNTQIPNYLTLKKEIVDLYNLKHGKKEETNNETEENNQTKLPKVIFNGVGQYVKMSFLIPDFAEDLKRKT